jgi:hypothetical protein
MKTSGRCGTLSVILKFDSAMHAALIVSTVSTGNSILHIEMRRWADILVVAPASANLLSKAACGIADNFVLSVLRAWDFRKPCVLCPAMNTAMWTHPSTKDSLGKLQSWGWEVLGPVEKVLACNEKGNGAMVSVQDIKAYLLAKLASRVNGTHALTNANLQLHGLLMNSSHSHGTTAEPPNPISPDHATLDMYQPRDSTSATTHGRRAHSEVIPAAALTAPTVDLQNVNLKAKLAARGSPKGKSVTTQSEPAHTLLQASALAAPVKPAQTVDHTASPATSVVTKATAVPVGRTVVGRAKDMMVQSFMLGVGVGVGFVLANMAVGALNLKDGFSAWDRAAVAGVTAAVPTAVNAAAETAKQVVQGVHRATI